MENTFNREDFMSFFRDDEKLNTLTPDDRVEVFKIILLGSSDITVDLLNEIILDYSVDNISICDIKKQDEKLFSYNEIIRRFNQLEHRITFSTLFKNRFLESFKRKLK